MPVHTRIVQRLTRSYGCDLCGVYGRDHTYYDYNGQSPINRQEPNGNVLILSWLETRYTVCAVCKGYIQSGNIQGLEYRIVTRNPRIRPKQIRARVDEFFAHKRQGVSVGAHAR